MATTGSVTTSQIGLENRTEILPQPVIPTNIPGVFGPDYTFADNVPTPSQIGVKDGNTVGSVIDAVKGAAYYIDTIGFGQSSSSLTSGMGVRRLGVNTFMPTGFTCANGADMWMYMEGISTGNSVGAGLKKGLASSGMPQMRGLAPGIMEDANDALDPNPMMGAVFGTGYPSCKFVMKKVGDQDGKIQNPATGKYYVDDPASVVNQGGSPMQGRWVHDKDLDMDQYNAVPKDYCPNGYPKTSHKDSDCLKALQSRQMPSASASASASGFRNYHKTSILIDLIKMVAIATGVLLAIGVVHKIVKRR